MKNIRNLFKVNPATYFLILTFLLTGLIKNIIIIYLIVIIHELGHIFIIKLLKYKVIKIEILPSGGITTISKRINSNTNHDLLISIFGILFQILLFLIFKFLYYNSYILTSTYKMFLNYNKTIMLFNMIPIIPLDGYMFLRSIWEKFFSFKKSFYISFIISIIFILLFITYNEVYSLNNYLIISFLIYKIFHEYKNFKFVYLKFQLERFLNDLKFKKIRNEKNINLDLLKKDTYHYFKSNNTYISEKTLLKKKYDK